MTYENQKDDELFYLEQFLNCLRIKTDNIKKGNEPPDYTITIDGKDIAIEITEFHSNAKGLNNHSRREVEENWKKLRMVIRTERNKHSELKSINVNIYFKELNVPPVRDHSKFAKELVCFVIKKLGCISDKKKIFTDFQGRYNLLSIYLKELRFHNVGCYITWDWNQNAAFVGLSEKELEITISPKLKKYQPKKGYENWLLIVSGTNLSQAMGRPCIDELNKYAINKKLVKSPFDKVYIFQYMLSRVLLWQRYIGWQEISKIKFASPKT